MSSADRTKANAWEKQAKLFLDIINAVVLRDGGAVVIAKTYVDAATRRSLDITWSPDGSRLVIRPVGEIAEPPSPPFLRRLLAWLIG